MRTLTGFHPYTVVLLVSMFLLGGMTRAGEQASVDIEKLQNAQRLAARVFDETGNAEGAVKVLEEAGIAGLVKGRIAGIPVKTYAGLLETYGSLLSQLPDRRREAPAILKTVIETDPERASVYFHLGNLYYQLHRQEPRDSYLAVYSSAYRKYVDHLRKHGQQVLISSPVVEAAYGADGLDICGFTGLLQQQGLLADLNLFFNPETEVTNLSKAGTGEEGLPNASFTGFINGSTGKIRKSFIDVDNDGHPETWYSAASVTGDCRRSVFYRHVEGQSSLLSNGLLDGYYRPDRLCAGSGIFFVRYLRQNYLLEQQPLQPGDWETIIYRLTPNGDYSRLCNGVLPAARQGDLAEN